MKSKFLFSAAVLIVTIVYALLIEYASSGSPQADTTASILMVIAAVTAIILGEVIIDE